MIECTGTLRGNYLCSGCLGEKQPTEGPHKDVLYVVVLDGDTDGEEYICEPCVTKMLETGRFPKLTIVVPPQPTIH